MEKTLSLLAEINIDKEFITVVLKVAHQIQGLFTRVDWAIDETSKLQLLEYADYLLDLIADSYEDNEDYQYLVRFMRGEIDDRRYLLKKNSFCEADLLREKIKPTLH